MTIQVKRELQQRLIKVYIERRKREHKARYIAEGSDLSSIQLAREIQAKETLAEEDELIASYVSGKRYTVRAMCEEKKSEPPHPYNSSHGITPYDYFMSQNLKEKTEVVQLDQSTAELLQTRLNALDIRHGDLDTIIKAAREEQTEIKAELEATSRALQAYTGTVPTSKEAQAAEVQKPLIDETPAPPPKESRRGRVSDTIPPYKQRKQLTPDEIDERDILQDAILKVAASSPNVGEVTTPEVVRHLKEVGLGDYTRNAPNNRSFRLTAAFYELADNGFLEKTNITVHATPTRTHGGGRKALLYKLTAAGRARESESKEGDLSKA